MAIMLMMLTMMMVIVLVMIMLVVMIMVMRMHMMPKRGYPIHRAHNPRVLLVRLFPSSTSFRHGSRQRRQGR